MAPPTYPLLPPLPPKSRPNWVCPASAQLDLLYLAWGYRGYAEYRWPLQRHEGCHYVYCLSGAPSFVTPEGKYPLRPGELAIIDGDCPLSWIDQPGRKCRILTWVWRTAPGSPVLAPARGSWSRFRVDRPTARKLLALHEACRGEVSRVDAETRLSLQTLHGQLDVLLARHLRTSSSAVPSSCLDLAVRWLNTHLDSGRPVNELCDYLQVSPATLNRLFRSHLKTSVKSFVHEQRMRKARQLLEEGGLSVKETAYRLGYKYPNDLSRAYRGYWKAAG